MNIDTPITLTPADLQRRLEAAMRHGAEQARREVYDWLLYIAAPATAAQMAERCKWPDEVE